MEQGWSIRGPSSAGMEQRERGAGPGPGRTNAALGETFSDDYFGKPSGNPQSICMLIEVIYQSRVLREALHNNNSEFDLIRKLFNCSIKGRAEFLGVKKKKWH